MLYFLKKYARSWKKVNLNFYFCKDGKGYIDSIDIVSNMGRSSFWGNQFAAMSDKIGSLVNLGWLYVSGFGILG